ncbi:TonB-dependent receptor plug domain-containing protein [Suttonella sp. R2A3]|nr:TonB-dependent receptor plug domain-containing protein [Suttonella sp. R2A3]UJF25141.1 TonB-dependent receptor plug domain-containing protein [Suttonella sp. R2A3]
MYHKLSLITLTAVISANIYAQAQQNNSKSSRLDAITVEGNSLYGVLPSEGSNSYTLEAATVGTKIPASVRDIPQSVSIITQKAIRDHNANTFDRLAAKTPGLRVLENDEGRSSVYARGYEYDEYNVDGLPAQMQSINGTLPSLAAFDRVEVMRGPSGLFNSAGEMGGLLILSANALPTISPAM